MQHLHRLKSRLIFSEASQREWREPFDFRQEFPDFSYKWYKCKHHRNSLRFVESTSQQLRLKKHKNSRKHSHHLFASRQSRLNILQSALIIFKHFCRPKSTIHVHPLIQTTANEAARAGGFSISCETTQKTTSGVFLKIKNEAWVKEWSLTSHPLHLHEGQCFIPRRVKVKPSLLQP